MTTRPLDTPEWGTTALPADLLEPPPAIQSLGWEEEDSPPHQYVNWFWNRCADWVAHFASAASRLSLDGAFAVPVFAPLVFGDTFIGDDYDGATIPGELVPGLGDIAPVAAFTHGAPADVVSIGREVLYMDFGPAQNFVRSFARDGSSLVPIRTFTPSSLGQSKFTANETHVLVWQVVPSVTGDIEVFDRATGASLGTFSHGAELTRCSLGSDGDSVLIAGKPAAGPIDVRSLSIAGGLSVNWSYNHLGGGGIAAGHAVQVGRYVYVHGSTSGHASLATIRAIEAANGKDLANDGGNGVSTLPDVWDATTATSGTQEIAIDGALLVVSDDVLSTFDGTLIKNLGAVAAVTQIDIDEDYVYTAEFGAAGLIAFSRADGLVAVWRHVPPSGGIGGFSVDGAAVFLVNSSGPVGEQSPRIARGNRPRLHRRVDPSSDIGLPSHGRGYI